MTDFGARRVKFWYRAPFRRRDDEKDEFASVAQTADSTSGLPVLRALQTDLVAAFDDLRVVDEVLTFFAKRNNSTFVALVKVHIDADVTGSVFLDLDPKVVLVTLGIGEAALDDFLLVLPSPRIRIGAAPSEQLRVAVHTVAQIQQIASFLMRRYARHRSFPERR